MTCNAMAISAAKAAELLGISRSEVYKLAKRTDFPAFKIGERVVVSVKGLEAWVERKASEEADIEQL